VFFKKIPKETNVLVLIIGERTYDIIQLVALFPNNNNNNNNTILIIHTFNLIRFLYKFQHILSLFFLH
jgi:CRISPR/Cas system-associated protein endoribonuclease Cas2